MTNKQQLKNMHIRLRSVYYVSKKPLANVRGYTIVIIPRKWDARIDSDLNIQHYDHYQDACLEFEEQLYLDHAILLMYEWYQDTQEPKEIMRDVYRKA